MNILFHNSVTCPAGTLQAFLVLYIHGVIIVGTRIVRLRRQKVHFYQQDSPVSVYEVIIHLFIYCNVQAI